MGWHVLSRNIILKPGFKGSQTCCLTSISEYYNIQNRLTIIPQVIFICLQGKMLLSSLNKFEKSEFECHLYDKNIENGWKNCSNYITSEKVFKYVVSAFQTGDTIFGSWNIMQ